MGLPISVNLMPQSHIKETVALAKLAEKLGYKRCWIYDEGLHTRDVYVTLSCVALSTKHILLGPGITNSYTRHPGTTAAAIASLDELSNGRAFIGLGAGGGLTLDPFGIKRSNPITTVSDTVFALRELFSGQRVDLRSKEFSLQSALLSYGRSDIEIFLAGRGPKMTRLGADVADGFYLSYIHKDFLLEHITTLRKAAVRQPYRIIYSTMIVSSAEEFDEARCALSFRLVDSPIEVKERIGMNEKDTDLIRQALLDGGPKMAAKFVQKEWVEQFVIVGTLKEAAAELKKLMEDYDIDEFQLPVGQSKDQKKLIERTSKMFV